MMHRVFPLMLLALASCGTNDGDAPLSVSVVGDKARLIDPNSGSATRASLILSGAIAQGLVQHNPAGEVVPALAESWMVTDDGLSYIFRVSRLFWADGRRVSAFEVSASLRASIGAASRNPLKPHLGGITDIVAMTDRVIEVRLAAPNPNLLELFARPEMAVMQKGKGSGSMQIIKTEPTQMVLRPALTKEQAETVSKADLERSEVSVRGESAPRAIARFVQGQASLVTAGSFTDLPYLFEARLQRDRVRRDPVSGLFGLVASSTSPALAGAETRRALAIAIDRPALMGHFGLANWPGTDIPTFGLSDARPLQQASPWITLDMAERRKRARAMLGRKLALRIALPSGPGSAILFAHLKADFAQIGVTLARTSDERSADLRLIDEVATVATTGWYLDRLGCNRGFYCSDASAKAHKAALSADTREERDKFRLEAVEALLKDQIFIPISTPLRWSLARPDLAGFRENAAGVHPIRWLRRAEQ